MGQPQGFTYVVACYLCSWSRIFCDDVGTRYRFVTNRSGLHENHLSWSAYRTPLHNLQPFSSDRSIDQNNWLMDAIIAMGQRSARSLSGALDSRIVTESSYSSILIFVLFPQVELLSWHQIDASGKQLEDPRVHPFLERKGSRLSIMQSLTFGSRSQ